MAAEPWSPAHAVALVRHALDAVDRQYGERGYELNEYRALNVAIIAAYEAKDLGAVRHAVNAWRLDVEERCREAETAEGARRDAHKSLGLSDKGQAAKTAASGTRARVAR